MILILSDFSIPKNRKVVRSSSSPDDFFRDVGDGTQIFLPSSRLLGPSCYFRGRCHTSRATVRGNERGEGAARGLARGGRPPRPLVAADEVWLAGGLRGRPIS
jgi:hypothetical protein